MTERKQMCISVEGGVGAGKSELLNYLSRNGHRVVLEPTTEWEANLDSKTGKNIIELFYENPQRHAFMFQIFALTTRMMAIERAIRERPYWSGCLILERGIDTDRYVFADTLYRDGTLTELEYRIYQSYAQSIARSPSHRDSKFSVDGMIYLHTSVDRCLERIETRNRKGEEHVNIQYLHALAQSHDRMIEKAEQSGLPILILDGDLGLDDLPNKLRQIEEFVLQIQEKKHSANCPVTPC
jgi:deoxyadenosine/deoxycytidine kinase